LKIFVLTFPFSISVFSRIEKHVWVDLIYRPYMKSLEREILHWDKIILRKYIQVLAKCQKYETNAEIIPLVIAESQTAFQAIYVLRKFQTKAALNGFVTNLNF